MKPTMELRWIEIDPVHLNDGEFAVTGRTRREYPAHPNTARKMPYKLQQKWVEREAFFDTYAEEWRDIELISP